MIEHVVWWMLVSTLVGLGIVTGLAVSNHLLARRRRTLEGQEASIQAGWDALHTAQRLSAGFWEAWKMMREEALRRRGLTPDDRPGSRS